MLIPLTTIAASVFAGLAVMGTALHAVALSRLRRHLGAGPKSAEPASEPITHWRAVKRGIPDLAGKIEALVRAAQEGDQILIGVDAGAPEAAICAEACERVPGVTVRRSPSEPEPSASSGRFVCIIECEPGRAMNPKISKFLQMAPHALHARWLLTDSEAELDADFIEAFRREWSAENWDALTAGYRFTGLRRMPQILDVAPALFTLWPGLMHARQIDFTLGACTGVMAAHVRAIGGWEAFATLLAEDRELGRQLAGRGHRVGLSRQVLSLSADPLGWWDWLKHQHRVAVTYRLAAPAGALGLPIMHALPLALLAGALGGGWWWALPGLVWLLRCAIASRMARLLHYHIRGLAAVMAVVPIVETFAWATAWLPLPVWWAGSWRSFRYG